MKADFHIHTTHSDGTKTQREIFELAKQQKLDYISITDHDVCKNVELSFELAKEFNISFIPGIELSTLEKGKPVHVLGFFRDDSYNNEDMKAYYKMIKQGRETRTHKFIQGLKEFYSIEITYEDVLKFSNGIIARPHIAKAIREKYPHYDFDYIFDHFIGDHSKAYVPSTKLKVAEGIELLRKNNCVTILAHPTLLKDRIKDKVLEYDFDGIEARYYRNNENDEDTYRELAKSRDMILSAGSDYHGIKNDSKHGFIGEVTLDGTDLDEFLKFYNK